VILAKYNGIEIGGLKLLDLLMPKWERLY